MARAWVTHRQGQLSESNVYLYFNRKMYLSQNGNRFVPHCQVTACGNGLGHSQAGFRGRGSYLDPMCICLKSCKMYLSQNGNIFVSHCQVTACGKGLGHSQLGCGAETVIWVQCVFVLKLAKCICLKMEIYLSHIARSLLVASLGSLTAWLRGGTGTVMRVQCRDW